MLCGMLDTDALADVDGDCGAIYSMARAELDAPPSIATLVRRLLGVSPRLVSMKTEASLAMVEGQPRIFVRRGTRPTRARWLAGHELAEWWYARVGYRGEDIEERCDALGAALVIPRPAFVRAWRTYGDDPAEIATALDTTQSLALLRLGECIGTPVVLLRPGGPIVRGSEFVWPCEAELRRAAKIGRPGLRKVQMTDEPPRVGLFAV